MVFIVRPAVIIIVVAAAAAALAVVGGAASEVFAVRTLRELYLFRV